MTEQEMRDSKAPTPKTIEELNEYINSLLAIQHDYGTCCYAMSLAATATFNFVASSLDVTGFQASCADLDILRRTRLINGPFAIVKAEDMLYPQYDIPAKVESYIDGWKSWARDEALKKLEAAPDAHPNVLNHWKNLAEDNYS